MRTVLWLIVLAALVELLVLLTSSHSDRAGHDAQVMASATVLVNCLLSLGLGRFCGPRPASAWFCMSAATIFLASAWAAGNGVASAGTAALPGLIVLAAFTVGSRYAALLAIAAALGLLGLWFGESLGLIAGGVASKLPPAGSVALVKVATCLAVGYLMWCFARLYWRLLAEMEDQQAGLASAVRSMSHLTAELKDREGQLRAQRANLEREVVLRTLDIERERRHVQAVIEALPITLAISESNGRLLRVNRRFEEVSGVTRERLLSHMPSHPAAASGAGHRSGPAQLLLPELPGAALVAQSVEREVLRPDGGHADFLLIRAPILGAEGEPTAFINLGTDVSALKQLERELRGAKESAEQLAQARSDFLSNMSHEIRTPLNAILGHAQLAALDAGASPQGQRRIGAILQSGQFLLRLVNDILDTARFDSGKFDLELRPCRLERLLADALGLVAGSARAKGLTLTHQVDAALPRWIRCDGLRTAQVLVNLLSNAVKFTESGHVALRVRAGTAGSSPTIEFEIEDTGCGIPTEAIPRLFRPFEQADSSVTRRHGGTGLGLSLSRRFAQLMGGEIDVQSRLGAGSRFTFRMALEASEPPLMNHAPESGDLPRLDGCSVLVVDDVDINRAIVREMLEGAGANVTEAADGPAALQLLSRTESTRFTVALLDVQMPDMDGCELARQIAKTVRHLPLIALTAHATPSEQLRTRAAGMREHLCKPVQLRELLEAVHNASQDAAAAPTAAAPPRWPDIEGCDFDAALERCNGRLELMRRLLGQFHHHYSQAEIRAEMGESAHPARLDALAHRLAGTAASLGLMALAGAAKQRDLAQMNALLATALDRIGRWLGGAATQ